MNEGDFSRLVAFSQITLSEKKATPLRPASLELLGKVKDSKLIFAVKGLRGVGKSSLVIEFLKKKDKSLYVNSEFLLKYGLDLYEVLEFAKLHGYSCFGIDEIQVLKNWPANLKLFYDSSKAQIIITGSSAIELALQSSDLARRIQVHDLKPLSFREYIFFKTGKLLKKKSVKEVIVEKNELTKEIAQYAALFEEYVTTFALPSALFEGKETYQGVIERVVYNDLLTLKSIDVTYVDAAFKVLKFLASSSPGEVSYNAIANSIGRSVKFTIELTRLLQLSGVITMVNSNSVGHAAIRREGKLLFPLSLRSALGDYFKVEINKGAIREDFFIQHVANAKYLKESGKKTPDYEFDGKVFEVGGSGKRAEQIKGMKNAFLVKESLACTEKEIPLYLFGLTY